MDVIRTTLRSVLRLKPIQALSGGTRVGVAAATARTSANPKQWWNRRGAGSGSGAAYGGFALARTTTRALCAGTAPEVAAEKVGALTLALPYALGAAGLIPFVALTPQAASALGGLPALQDVPGLTCVLSRAPEMQLWYSALICSFLGGVHWGTAMSLLGGPKALPLRYIWGVTPSLLAWGSLALPYTSSVFGCMCSLGLCYAADSYFLPFFPKWYATLRVPLTVVACGSLSLSLYTAYSKSDPASKASEKTKLQEEKS
mmetsp:Transcript_5614/g.10209  ORF Transcript_5614/g.10209 Transcript_5614/m.10209 type:complete len:259 (+) Transcript_5614:64-840(+)